MIRFALDIYINGSQSRNENNWSFSGYTVVNMFWKSFAGLQGDVISNPLCSSHGQRFSLKLTLSLPGVKKPFPKIHKLSKEERKNEKTQNVQSGDC